GGGGGGGTALTVTDAVSLAVTSGPTSGCPVAVAVLTKEEVTLLSVQLKLDDAPAARLPIVFAQPGACASVTVTFDRAESPVFFTRIVKVAVPPLLIDWLSGSLAIEIDGWITVTSALSFAATSGPTGG